MIHLAENFSGNHKKVKHLLTRINFLIEQVHMNHIKFQHVSSDKNVADILTKPLGPCDFLRLRPHLLGAENFSCDRSDDRRVGTGCQENEMCGARMENFSYDRSDDRVGLALQSTCAEPNGLALAARKMKCAEPERKISYDRSDDRVGLALEPNVRSPMG
jgi:hypothetical protein